MLQKLMLLLIGIYIIILSSCAFAIIPAVAEQGYSAEDHPYFTPDEPNMTKLSKEKDLKLDISRSDENQQFPMNFKLGYSPIKHLGILANHYNSGGSQRLTFANASKKWKYQMTDLGVGTYFLLQNEKQKKLTNKNPNFPVGVLFDIYAGYGLGKNKNNYIEGGNDELNVQKIYLQAGVHFHHQLLGISLINRLSNVNFTKGKFTGQANLTQINGFSYIVDNNKFTNFETAVKISFGTERVQFYTGLISSNLQEEVAFPFRKSKGYMGLLVNLNAIWEKIK